MQLLISSSGPPIYQQIADQIRHRILSGVLRPGDELPPIRGLAERLRVNPNTVARAYRELEVAGLVEKRRTIGTFVTDSPERLSDEQKRRILAPHLKSLLTQARSLGIELDDLTALLQQHHRTLNEEEVTS